MERTVVGGNDARLHWCGAWFRASLMYSACAVFGITGSTTMYFVRPAVTELLQIQGSFIEGPWT